MWTNFGLSTKGGQAIAKRAELVTQLGLPTGWLAGWLAGLPTLYVACNKETNEPGRMKFAAAMNALLKCPLINMPAKNEQKMRWSQPVSQQQKQTPSF